MDCPFIFQNTLRSPLIWIRGWCQWHRFANLHDKPGTRASSISACAVATVRITYVLWRRKSEEPHPPVGIHRICPCITHETSPRNMILRVRSLKSGTMFNRKIKWNCLAKHRANFDVFTIHPHRHGGTQLTTDTIKYTPTETQCLVTWHGMSHYTHNVFCIDWVLRDSLWNMNNGSRGWLSATMTR